MKIYFIRHGETVWNTKRLFQGTSNSPLTEKGRKQAEKLGERLGNIQIDGFYSSPLGRTLETSHLIIGSRNIEIRLIDEFREISVGNMEGVPREEFQSRYPVEFDDFANNPKDYNPSAYGGESYYSVIERVKVGLEKLISNHRESENIVVVSHGVTLKVLMNILKNGTIETLKDEEIPRNTSLSIVEYRDGMYSIELFSDISHLEEGL